MKGCAYKDIFGKPGQGIHSLRIPFPGTKNGIALVDTVLTLLAAYLFCVWKYKKPSMINVAAVFFILVIASIFIHRLFCVETALERLFC